MVKEIYYGKQSIGNDDLKLLVKSVKQKFVTTGPMVQLFEKKISKYLRLFFYQYRKIC